MAQKVRPDPNVPKKVLWKQTRPFSHQFRWHYMIFYPVHNSLTFCNPSTYESKNVLIYVVSTRRASPHIMTVFIDLSSQNMRNTCKHTHTHSIACFENEDSHCGLCRAPPPVCAMWMTQHIKRCGCRHLHDIHVKMQTDKPWRIFSAKREGEFSFPVLCARWDRQTRFNARTKKDLHHFKVT